MKIFVLAENREFENRVSITPEVAKKLIEKENQVFVLTNAGETAGFSDYDYQKVGAIISIESELSGADVVFCVNPLSKSQVASLKNGATVIGALDPFNNKDIINSFAEKNINSFSLDFIARTTKAQYMDILSSQASLAGYKAVIEAAHILNRAFPLMMTTAGTIPAAKVLIIGAGVAGLQAIATAKRLGANVSAFDVRVSAKEQVESLGAKFVEVESEEKTDGIYAKEMTEEYKKAQEEKLRSVLPSQDIVITTAQIPGKKAPIIIKSDMVDIMKQGSLILDLASKAGGNCELTESGRVIQRDGVSIISFDNILNLIAHDASRLFAKNLLAFFDLLIEKQNIEKNIELIDDEIIKSTLITANKKIINSRLQVE